MGKLYCMGDIHGFLDVFDRRLNQLGGRQFFQSGENTLILLGDYIDDGPESGQVLRRIYELQKAYADCLVVLRGNHEEDFLAWLDAYAGPGAGRWDEYGLLPYHPWLDTDRDLRTFRSFLTSEQWDRFKGDIPALSQDAKNTLAARMVLEGNGELIGWLRGLPYYYETDRQIFVHAGIDEEAGDWWREGTPESMFVGKYPAVMGPFEKDIIAGHIGTHTLMGDPDFHDVLWDGENHYFCDGTVVKSGKIPVLVYDTDTERYYSLGDDEPTPPGDGLRVRGELYPVPRCPKEQAKKWRGDLGWAGF